MIKILNSSLTRLAALKNVLDANRLEKINGENTLDFGAIFDGRVAEFVNEDTVYELDDEYFDTAMITKSANDDGMFTVAVEAEHISYRLNNPTYNVQWFTEIGLPSYILGKILEGTGFTVGTVEFTTSITYSAQEAKSRRQLLMELVAYLEGEISFNKFEVNILAHRGSTEITSVIKDRNVKVVSKTVNKRQKDNDGNDLVSYVCTPIFVPGDSYTLGDDVVLLQKDLGLNERLRIISISRNPYDEMETTLEFANYTNGLESALFRIETNTIAKGKLYYGARISPEMGFESIRSDLKARTVMNADTFEMQVGDGTGLWYKRLWFDPELGLYIFDGTLSADTIEAVKAEIDIVVSQTVIVNNLTAENAYIADLTVDRVNTSKKVRKRLVNDTSDVHYTKQEDQVLMWIEAQYNPVLPEIHVENRYGEKLYWTDATHTGVTETANDLPIMEYGYDEFIKRKDWFMLDPSGSGYQIPVSEWGVGSGFEDNGKFRMYKGTKGAYLDYYHSSTGALRRIMLTDDGIDFSETVEGRVIYSDQTLVSGVVQVFVDTEMPEQAKEKDVLIDIDNPTIGDFLYLSSSVALTWDSPLHITAKNEIIINLPSSSQVLTNYSGAGVVCIRNMNLLNGMITVTPSVAEMGFRLINGQSNYHIPPQQTVVFRFLFGTGQLDVHWEAT